MYYYVLCGVNSLPHSLFLEIIITFFKIPLKSLRRIVSKKVSAMGCDLTRVTAHDSPWFPYSIWKENGKNPGYK